MQKIKTGIVGLGKVAHMHAKALAKIPESSLTAVCSRDRDKAADFAELYGVRPFTDVEDMIISGGVETVVICTPHPFHLEPALRAMNTGAHVLIEKPLASSLADCDKMLACAVQNKVKLGMVSQRRFYPSVMRIRQAIDSGKIGRPVLGTVNMLGWRDKAYYDSDAWRGTWAGEGGGVLVNQAPHQIDLLQWFMGPVDELYGIWSNLNHPYLQVDDTALAVIRFKNGGVGNIIVSNSQNPALYGKVHVHGENGASVGVQTDGGAMFIAGMTSITEPPVNDLWTIRGEEDKLSQWVEEDTRLFNSVDPMQHFHELQDSDFLRSVLNDTRPLVDGADGRRTVEIFTAIYRSSFNRQPVKFPLTAETENELDGRPLQEKV